MQSRTLYELWYNVKILVARENILKDGADTDRFQGFGKPDSEKVRESMRKMWELGRSSVLRELAGKEAGEKWSDILGMCGKGWFDFDGMVGELPGYTEELKDSMLRPPT